MYAGKRYETETTVTISTHYDAKKDENNLMIIEQTLR